MSHEELVRKVKAECDQYSCDESDMNTLNLLWMIEAIDGDWPLHDAMEIAYEIQEDFCRVKNGLIAHW